MTNTDNCKLCGAVLDTLGVKDNKIVSVLEVSPNSFEIVTVHAKCRKFITCYTEVGKVGGYYDYIRAQNEVQKKLLNATSMYGYYRCGY